MLRGATGCLLVALVAPSEVCAQVAPAAFRIELAPRERARVDEAPEGLRILGELGAAFVPAAIAASVGATVGVLLPCGEWDVACPSQGNVLGGMTFAAPVGLLFSPAWVALVGRALGGRGHVGGAYLGCVVGAALAVPVIVGGIEWSDDGVRDGSGGNASVLGVGLALAGVLATAGSLIGYEITHLTAHGAHADRRDDDLGWSIVPDVALSPSGDWSARAHVSLAW